MTVKYGKFQMPEKIKIDDTVKKANHTKFIIEAFEKGFGHTLGNALRRTMLSCLESPALISIRIEGVPHEYTAIDGVVEDMTHIVLNLKESLLRKLPMEEDNYSREVKTITKQLDITQDQIDQGGGEYKVTVQDILGDSDFELVNPEHVIFSVTKPFNKKVTSRVGMGRGYVPAEKMGDAERQIDEIILDASFSPVRLVNYYVENSRVGSDTDYDRLILEVTTDGRIAPQEALTFASQIVIKHFKVFDELDSFNLSYDEGEEEENKDREEILRKLALKINEIELSVRSTNCLAMANINTIGELVVMPESEMLRFRNFGKKSLTEIKEKLVEMELGLGMDLSKYGINRDNIKTIIENYLEERGSTES